MIDDELFQYKKNVNIEVNKEKIEDTIKKSKAIFFEAEKEKRLTYIEFVLAQLKMIQKRWWIFQFLLLCGLGMVLQYTYDELYIEKILGVVASLFVILMIPELWKNKSNNCVEIENTAYYSLRQIYSARMVLFGIVDILLLTAFCVTSTLKLNLEFSQLIFAFILPLLITSCICFVTLSSKRIDNEYISIFLCMMWSAVWLFIILNERVYQVISLPILLFIMLAVFIILGISIRNILKNSNECKEVTFDGIKY